MPHLLLDAKANDFAGMSTVQSSSADQRLSLGAPFGEQYTLYAPQGYDPDTFYLLPPDLLSMLIEAPADIDIEIVNQWMFLYARSGPDPLDSATWQTLGETEATVSTGGRGLAGGDV